MPGVEGVTTCVGHLLIEIRFVRIGGQEGLEECNLTCSILRACGRMLYVTAFSVDCAVPVMAPALKQSRILRWFPEEAAQFEKRVETDENQKKPGSLCPIFRILNLTNHESTQHRTETSETYGTLQFMW